MAELIFRNLMVGSDRAVTRMRWRVGTVRRNRATDDDAFVVVLLLLVKMLRCS